MLHQPFRHPPCVPNQPTPFGRRPLHGVRRASYGASPNNLWRWRRNERGYPPKRRNPAAATSLRRGLSRRSHPWFRLSLHLRTLNAHATLHTGRNTSTVTPCRRRAPKPPSAPRHPLPSFVTVMKRARAPIVTKDFPAFLEVARSLASPGRRLHPPWTRRKRGAGRASKGRRDPPNAPADPRAAPRSLANRSNSLSTSRGGGRPSRLTVRP